MEIAETSPRQKIFTVSELNAEIKALLERQYPFIWVSGETSNFHRASSGHYYFTLKDENSQISAVMFRGQNRNLKFELEDGLRVTGLGRISVYEPRGTYQIIFEYLEPKGIGALQVAFEQLKARLSSEGLFDASHKKSLPFLPQKISLITSPTGAVVYDILNIATRRFPNLAIEILPVNVQGYSAPKEIASAIDRVNSRGNSDVVILARGGGSLEDLQGFNSEVVARAIFNSVIPVVSAVGHETDFTIADFVADLRAPTPSAAAELVVPLKAELRQKIRKHNLGLTAGFNRRLLQYRSSLREVSSKLLDPKRKISDFRLKIDDYSGRLNRMIINHLVQKRERYRWRAEKLHINSPLSCINTLRERLIKISDKLFNLMLIKSRNRRHVFAELNSKLEVLNPKGILNRGYSITRTIPDGSVVRNADQVDLGQNLEVLLSKGSIKCRVKRKYEDAQENV
jgi:exodeoxyribonuclease VII large subunit